MWPVTADQLAMLRGNHALTATCHVYSGSTYRGQIQLVDGTVTADAGRQVTREASLTVDRYVVETQGLLDPLSDQVVIRAQIPNVVDIPLFVGRVSTVTDVETHTVTVRCVDHADDVIAAKFEVPWSSYSGQQARAVAAAMIADVDPTFSLDVADVPPTTLPVLTWEQDRGAALDEITAALGRVWQANRVGSFAMPVNPFSLDVMPPGVVTLRDDAADAARTLISVEGTKSRDGLANSVTLIVERTDGSAPLRVTVRDSGAASPTRWGGPAGKRNQVVSLQTPLTAAGAKQVATRRLRQLVALARTWSITDILAVLLDPLDVVTLFYRGEVTQQVVQSTSVSLMPTVAGSFTSREWRTLTPLEGED